MFLRIEGSSEMPIYRQIMDQIRDSVAAGGLKAGQKMPSVRVLAEELGVNQNTILKVYNELCREGVLRMERGSGTFVAETSEEVRIEERQWIIESMLGEVVDKAKLYGIDVESLRKMMDRQISKRSLGTEY